MDWVFVSPGPSCKFMCGSLTPSVMVLEMGPLGGSGFKLGSLVGRATLMYSLQVSTLSLSLPQGNTAVYEPGSQPSPGTKPASGMNLDLTSRTVRNKCCLSHPVDGILIAAQPDKILSRVFLLRPLWLSPFLVLKVSLYTSQIGVLLQLLYYLCFVRKYRSGSLWLPDSSVSKGIL